MNVKQLESIATVFPVILFCMTFSGCALILLGAVGTVATKKAITSAPRLSKEETNKLTFREYDISYDVALEALKYSIEKYGFKEIKLEKNSIVAATDESSLMLNAVIVTDKRSRIQVLIKNKDGFVENESIYQAVFGYIEEYIRVNEPNGGNGDKN